MKAIWNGKIIAESDDTVVVESNHYFPAASVKMEYLKKSGNKYTCHWKGVCDYYDVAVDGEVCQDCSWMYPEPTKPAQSIKGRFAFWQGVKIVSS
ncbi:MAG: DUF427 domain-containing protein [Candidatus Doudnabacteria bacterium]|nr:DUF427 domain-containing protein [Candidatus Doudnabacteria bacterium]